MQFSIIIPFFFMAAAVCIGMLFYTLKCIKVVSSGPAALLLLMMAVWALTSGLELMLTSLQFKLRVTNIAYIAFAMVSPCWVLFSFSYITRKSQSKNILIIVLFSVFSLFIILNWFNPGNLFYRSIELIDKKGLIVLSFTYGPLFWAYSAASYICLSAMMLYMIFSRRTGRLSPKNLALLLCAAGIPILFNLLYVLKVSPFDITPFGFVLTCLSMYLLYKNEFFSHMPPLRERILEIMSDGYILVDPTQHVIELNSAALGLLSLDNHEHAEAAAEEIIKKWDLFAGNTQDSGIKEFITASGQPHYYRVSVSRLSLKNNYPQSFLVFIHDETALYAMRERMRYLERYDEATDLYNRQYFVELLNREIEEAVASRESVILISASIANYRDYCYMYGTEFGSALIYQMSRIIKEIVRSDDLIGRSAQDELCICMRYDGDGEVATRIEQLMKRIYIRLNEPLEIGGIKLHIKLYAGVAVAPVHADNGSRLIGMTHMARHNIMKSAKYPYAVYHHHTGEEYERLMRLEQDLEKALTEEQFYLVYQPQVDSRNGRVVGVEALLRWEHPELGAVGPNEFISLAEENGMIRDIGFWVIRQVIKQMQIWQESGLKDLKVSANISLNQLIDANFADKVIDMCEETNIDVSYLELEVTESLALFPEALKHGHLQKLRHNKIRIAMDDFGMGHSSLSYIRTFELDTIKIDRALTCDILNNNTSVVMINSVHNLCESLNMDMVIEHVESPEQVELLKSMNCFIIQGYVYMPPLSADACTNYILKSREK